MLHDEELLATVTEQEKRSARSGVGPAVGLFFLAPLVAEFLLGNLPIKLLPALIVLAPLYGGGALLIREWVRGTKHGWPSIFVLGLAYAVLEEAFTTQSLFNPDYLSLKMRLLESAYIPALGIGGWWTMLMLNLHTAWSIATPIALVEAAVPDRSSTRWLGRTGLVVTGVLFAIGVVATTIMGIKRDPFAASPSQLITAGLLCVTLIVLAFRMPRAREGRRAGWVPTPWVVGALALTAGSAVGTVPKRYGWWAAAALLVVDMCMVSSVVLWSRRAGWDMRHKLALAGGAALAYAWHAFLQPPAVGGSGVSVRIGNGVFALGAIGLIWMAARRTSAAMRTGAIS